MLHQIQNLRETTFGGHLHCGRAKAESLGAKTLVPPITIPGVGIFAWFSDPDANTIGLLQKKS